MRRHLLPALFVLLAASAAPCLAQSAASAATAASGAAPAQRSVSEIVGQIASSEALQRLALERLPVQQHWQDLTRRIDEIEATFTRELPSAAGTVDASDLVGLSHDAWSLSNRASDMVHELTVLVARLERERSALELDARRWAEDLPVLREGRVPERVIEGAQTMSQQVQATADQVRAARDRGLLALVRAQALQSRISTATARIANTMERMMAQRSQLETLPIWQLGATPGEPSESLPSLRIGAVELRGYLVREGRQLALLAVVVFGLCWWLFMRPAAPGASASRLAYGRPAAASLLIAMVALWWLSPDPPVLFYNLLLIFLPLPAVALARGAIGVPVPITLYGVAVATIIMGLRRNVADWSALTERILLLTQIGCVALPLALDLRSGRLTKAFSRWSAPSVRAVALILLLAAALSALHAVVGLLGPSRALRVGLAGLLAFGLIFGTAAMALYGALQALLATPLLGWLHSARTADPSLLRVLRVALFLLALAATVTATLGAMTLMPVVLAEVQSMSLSNVDVGALSFSSTALAAFLAFIVGTVLLSGLIHFVLVREVFPRLRLRPGVGYAITTFTRWAIYFVGIVLALAALGVDATRLTVLAGALGVGIGFGLQTVVNNFVSGLILIVERPVAVGDLVEIGPLLGEIQRIGIRSSSVRTTPGAEVIVPNSDFASKEVINWTRSDRQRRYDIDVGVAYGSDPALVMRLLEEAAGEVPEVMQHPAPMAMFKDFGDSSLDFRLLAWVSTIDLGLKAQTAIRVAVLRKLDAAGISIPFPQRDVYLHAVADAAPLPPAG